VEDFKHSLTTLILILTITDPHDVNLIRK